MFHPVSNTFSLPENHVYFLLQGGVQLGTSAASVKLQVKREMEAERKAMEQAQRVADMYDEQQETFHNAAPVLAVSGVYYKCPMAGPAVLPRKDMEKYIEDFLLSQLPEEPAMTSSLMIQTLNKDKEKVRAGVEIMCKYLDNIINHPGEEKYRKIRFSNKALQERVLPLTGAQEFMQAAGFERKMMEGPQEIEEEYLVMNADTAVNLDHQLHLREILLAAEPIRPELDRNVKVYHSSPRATRIEVPDEFYTISPEEMKREQQARQEAVERLGMLRTKEMREREQLRELRRYRYCLLRIRFPDGPILQGTFRAVDRLYTVLEFVRDNLDNDWIPFYLNTQTGYKLTDENLSLAEMGLAPASIVNFAYDQAVLHEVAAEQGASNATYLKPDLLAQMQNL